MGRFIVHYHFDNVIKLIKEDYCKGFKERQGSDIDINDVNVVPMIAIEMNPLVTLKALEKVNFYIEIINKEKDHEEN